MNTMTETITGFFVAAAKWAAGIAAISWLVNLLFDPLKLKPKMQDISDRLLVVETKLEEREG
jgi:hypothetical protein